MENNTNIRDEQMFLDLFSRHQNLPENSAEFFSSQETIAKKILEKYKYQFEVFKLKCSQTYKIDPSDCESWVYEAVLKTIQKFKVGHGKCKFNSFLWTVINGIINTKIKMQHFKKRDVDKIQELYEMGADGDIDLAEPTDFIDNLHNKLVVEELFSLANPRQKEVLQRLLLGKNVPEISRELNVPCPTISSWIQKLGNLSKKKSRDDKRVWKV